jgi:alpha-mannosidase
MNQVQREQLRTELCRLAGERSQLAERFLAEMEFAEGLLRLHPARQRQWGKLLAQAAERVGGVVAAGRLERLPRAVADAEKLLAPVAKVAKQYTVHCVGHAHIDMNWMWSWPETVAVTNDTFLTVLKLMEEFGDFCFTQSQASVYALARDYHPELFEQIKRRVAEGRWEIAAVHWVEGDKNLAAGEGLARHLLYTRRFFAEHFGLAPEEMPLDWEPDTFGHAATIPTIVSRGAVRRYYLCRGGKSPKPPVFRWRGPDGSEILVNLETTWYNDHLGPHNAPACLAFCRKTGLKDWMCVYGVGDHGGGPTRRDIHRCHEMDSWPLFPNFRLATTRRYYEILEGRAADLPELTGELNFEFTGCYTTQTRIKRTNRLAEHLLGFSEAAAVLAWRAAGRRYPSELLRASWIDALFGHFHDILPGSGVRETREYHMGRFQNTAAAASAVATNSLRSLAAAIDTSSFAAETRQADTGMAMGAGAGLGTHWGDLSRAAHAAGGPRTYVAFNPVAWPRKETLTVTVWDTGDGGVDRGAFVARFPDGSAVGAQRLGRAAGDYWGHRHVDLAVPVSVGAMGYTTFAIEPAGRHVPEPAWGYGPSVVGPAAEMPVQPSVRTPGELAMENELLCVRLDGFTGGIVELVDKRGGTNLVDPARPAGLLEYVLERPGGMTAWIIHEPQKRICPLEVHSIEQTAGGPHVAAVVAKAKVLDSSITVTYRLAAAQPRLEIDLEVDWLERGSPQVGTPKLRFLLPLALGGAAARYEVPFGSIQRSLNGGEEVPALRWADVTGTAPGGKAAGCALLNDSKYGHSLDGSTLAVTLIRSSYDPDPLPEIGQHRVRLALVPHAGRLSTADLVRAGAGFNQPVRVLAADAHRGTLPPSCAGIRQVRPAGVILEGIKKAEDQDAVIFRLYDAAGRSADASVVLDADLFGRIAEAVEVDLLERPLAESTARSGGERFSVRVPAFGIASVKVTFQP